MEFELSSGGKVQSGGDAGRPRPKIDVLLAIPTLTPGGAERVFLNLARNFDRSRFNVTLLVFDLAGAAYLDEIPPDVTLLNLQSRVRSGLLRAVRHIRATKPSIVLSTLNHLNVALGLTKPLWPREVRYAVRPTLPVSTDFAEHVRSPMGRMAYRLGYGNADCFIFQSQAMADDFERVVKAPRNCSVVIPNPIDISRIRELARESPGAGHAAAGFKIVAAGRLDRQKGFDLLIDAVAGLRRDDVSLTILGEGPLRPVLEDQIRLLKIGDRVSLPGHVSNPYQYFSRSDLFALSSHFEGFPNVILEAIACGLPVVATPLPGIAELFREIPYCDVVDAISVDSIGAGLAHAIVAGPRRVPDGAVQKFDSAKVVGAYEDVLVKLANGAKSMVSA